MMSLCGLGFLVAWQPQSSKVSFMMTQGVNVPANEAEA